AWTSGGTRRAMARRSLSLRAARHRAPRDRPGAGEAALTASRVRGICLAASRYAFEWDDSTRTHGPHATSPAGDRETVALVWLWALGFGLWALGFRLWALEMTRWSPEPRA